MILRTIAIALAALFLTTAAYAQQGTREITKVAGDLYRFQNSFHVGVFLVTPEGVIATDPINAAAATWLKDEITKRFDQPVKYVVYSHHHQAAPPVERSTATTSSSSVTPTSRRISPARTPAYACPTSPSRTA